MNKSFLGIDLGTSAVKAVRVSPAGTVEKSRATYEEISPQGWYRALGNALRQLDLSDVAAVGLSSQVGTYIINDRDVISWSDGAGREETRHLRQRFSPEIFIREISMNHPDIISYPLPRMMYFQKHYEGLKTVCQPKDWICEQLTGNRVTDICSMRGLANAETGRYSDFLLKELELDGSILPPVQDPFSPAGTVTARAALETGLPEGLPVYIGMNDFYCALLGVGITEPGDAFDITGTSEHLGIIQPELDRDTVLASSPYLGAFVHYGVTASSGASLDFGLKQFGFRDVDPAASLNRKAPVFLPYLNGERAPIFDPDARGVFFGIGSGCEQTDLAYSVLEGNVFSLYSIWEKLGQPNAAGMACSGGAAKNPVLCQLKAELLNLPVYTLAEEDTSALGGAIIAAVGCGAWGSVSEAAETLVKRVKTYEPTDKLRSELLERFEIYRGLYPALRESFETWKEIQS